MHLFIYVSWIVEISKKDITGKSSWNASGSTALGLARWQKHAEAEAVLMANKERNTFAGGEHSDILMMSIGMFILLR